MGEREGVLCDGHVAGIGAIGDCQYTILCGVNVLFQGSLKEGQVCDFQKQPESCI